MSTLENKVTLNVLLNCEQTKSSETKQVHFKSLPTTPLEIKKKIEEDFSIPSCVQTLHYQSMILKDSDQLQHTHFRSGDVFTVDYPIEAECEMVRSVIKWLKELHQLSKSIEKDVAFFSEENDLMMSSNLRKIENLIIEGGRDGTTKALSETLLLPFDDKKKLMNHFYFQHEGGLDMLMKIYGMLVGKEWGGLGIDKELQIDLEGTCSLTISNYAHTILLQRQVVQLGGLEICSTALLRRHIWDEDTLDTTIYNTLYYALIALCR